MSDIVERLRGWATGQAWHHGKQAPESLLLEAADEIERLKAQIGGCPNATNGQHLFIACPIGTDGRQVTKVEPAATQYASGIFCQHCGKPA